jgi:hypothetical protein
VHLRHRPVQPPRKCPYKSTLHRTKVGG